MKRKLFIILLLCTIFINGFLYHLMNEKNISKFNRELYPIDCGLIFNNDYSEIQKALNLIQYSKNHQSLSNENFIFEQKECHKYIKIREFHRFENVTSQNERIFPIAFSILTYNNIEQFERFLRSIYRSHNIYCVHVDAKSKRKFHQAVMSITKCFDNVFISSRLENVIYAGYSRLIADLNCVRDLLNLKELIANSHPNFINKKYVEWKYLINAASSEFPLKTNHEMVQILKIMNGSNSIYIHKKDFSHRYKNVFKYQERKIIKTNELNTQVPHGIKITKGSAYFIANKEFLKNILLNQKILDFLEWLKSVYSPDEFFWSTIEYNTHLFSSSVYKVSNKTLQADLSRHVGWLPWYDCKGKIRHGICVYSVKDLPHLTNKKKFILNKLMLEYDPIAYQCFEIWYQNRVYDLANKDLIDKQFYINWVKSRTN